VLLTASISQASLVTVEIVVLMDVDPAPAVFVAEASGACCFTFQ
jgi:hypothetical protein